jgi:hypothetical protein
MVFLISPHRGVLTGVSGWGFLVVREGREQGVMSEMDDRAAAIGCSCGVSKFDLPLVRLFLIFLKFGVCFYCFM